MTRSPGELQTGGGASGEEEEPEGVLNERERFTTNSVPHICHILIESKCVNEHLTTIPLSNGSIALGLGLGLGEERKMKRRSRALLSL